MTIGIAILGTFVKWFLIISGTDKLFLILFGIRNMLKMVPDIAQSTHGIRNIFADIRNVPTRPHMVLCSYYRYVPCAYLASFREYRTLRIACLGLWLNIALDLILDNTNSLDFQPTTPSISLSRLWELNGFWISFWIIRIVLVCTNRLG